MDKIPPHDIDAEESTLGSCLIDKDKFKPVSRLVSTEDFYDERNQWIYSAMVALDGRRESINQITVAQELDRQGKLESCGGSAYFSHLVANTPTSMDAEYYAEIVRRLSFHRQLIQMARNIETQANRAEPDTNAVLDSITGMLDKFRQKHVQASNLITPSMSADILLELINQFSEQSIGIPTGFRDLDRLNGGMFPGELTVIGGESGTGKTELFMNIMDNIRNKNILFASVEMRVKGLLERKISRALGISIVDLRKGNLPFESTQKLGDLSAELYEGQLYITEKTNTSRQLYTLVQRMQETTGVDIVFVDYLQRLRDANSSNERNDLDIRRVAANLKSIAMDFDIPVITISSFNRDAAKRQDKTPLVSDLWGSGAIQYEADNILLVHRNVNNPDWEKYGDPHLLKVKQEKGRQTGSQPAVTLVYNDERRRYVDYFKQ